MRLIESEFELYDVLSFIEGKKVVTNSYFLGEQLLLLVKDKCLFYVKSEKNLVLFKKCKDGQYFELYYYLQDFSTKISLETHEPIAMEIPYRGASFYPKNEIDYWCSLGFTVHIQRDLMSLNVNNIDFQDLTRNDTFETYLIDDLFYSKTITDSIVNTFDFYTGDILTSSEVVAHIKNNEILGIFKDGSLIGFLRFYVKNNVSWIGHIIIFKEYSGMGAGKVLVHEYLKLQKQKGIKMFQHWIVSNNTPAFNLYNRFGYKVINKSSISLLKK